MKAVQRMLGHTSVPITLDGYSHLNDDDLEGLADAIDPRYRAAPGAAGAAQDGSGEVIDMLNEVKEAT